MTHRLDTAELRRDLDELAKRDLDVARAIERLGYPEPRISAPGFSTLLHAITAQQVSVRAAATIFGRIEVACGGIATAARVLELGETGLRQTGLSGRKAAYALTLAEGVASGRLDFPALVAADDEAAIAMITALRGFGRWSAEVYLLLSAGRPDVFPADDLALQVAYQRLKGLDARPTGKALRALVAPWAPLRGAGALLLWRVYGVTTLDVGAAKAPPPAGNGVADDDPGEVLGS